MREVCSCCSAGPLVVLALVVTWSWTINSLSVADSRSQVATTEPLDVNRPMLHFER